MEEIVYSDSEILHLFQLWQNPLIMASYSKMGFIFFKYGSGKKVNSEGFLFIYLLFNVIYWEMWFFCNFC